MFGVPFKFEIDPDKIFKLQDNDSDCSGDDEDYKSPEAEGISEDPEIQLDQPIKNYNELEKEMEAIHESGYVKKLVVKNGKGRVTEDSKVFIHYAAFAEGHDEPFDDTKARDKKPQEILLSKAEIILGLQIGLKTMEVGEVSKFMIFPKFGFGLMGCPPRIPAGARIVFTVELVGFIPKEKLENIMFMSSDDRAKLPFKDVLQGALDCKKQGSAKYNQGDYTRAVKLYSRGINLLEDYSTANEEDNTTREGALPELYYYKAQCFLKLGTPARACVACSRGLRFADGIPKAKLLIRYAEAKYMLNAFKEALDIVNRAIRFFRSHNIFEKKHSDLKLKIQAGIKTEKDNERYVYQRMFQLKTDLSANCKSDSNN